MAEEKAAEASGSPAPSPQKPTLFIVLALVNMLIVLGVGFMVFKGQKPPTEIEKVVNGLDPADPANAVDATEFAPKMVPMETFLVNLADSRGRKLIKINMEFQVNSHEVQKEIGELKPKIRDMVIMILTSKTYAQMSTNDGKEHLREEIKDKLNLFLTQGHIAQVLFTEFIYN